MTTTRLIRGSFGVDVSVEGRTCVQTDASDRGVVMYGPYEERDAGAYQVEFGIGLADATAPLEDPICVHIEVMTNDGRHLITERRILFSELTQGNAPFVLKFGLTEARRLEYRVQANGQVPLLVAQDVEVTALPEARTTVSPKGSQHRAWEYEREFLDGYLRNVSGVVHIGANYGQERRYYWLLGLEVLWIEPISEIYQELVDNIARYPRQRALNALLTDQEGQEIEFRIANNGGASSSILPLEGHAELFPGIEYVESRKLVSTTLAGLVRSGAIDISQYQALTIDTEGAELMVLKGASGVLEHFDYVKCEASDFQARSGNPSLRQLDELLRAAGFAQIGRRDFGMGPGHSGTNWDVVWKKVKPGEPLNEPGYTLPIIFDPMEVHGIEKDG